MPLQYTGILEEHRAVREAVGLFDVSHMGKILVEGFGVEAFLDGLSANRMPARVGRCVYTHFLRDDGTTLDDVIVSRLADARFFVVCNAGSTKTVLGWLEDHRPHDVALRDRTRTIDCLALQGPRAFDVIRPFSSSPFDHLRAFDAVVVDFRAPLQDRGSWAASPQETEGWGRDIRGAGTSGATLAILVTRTGYTGEVGIELFPPTAWSVRIWKSLLEEGRKAGIMPVGLGARDTLRLEKGFLLAGQDFDGRQTPLELGCEWIVKWDRPFVGREALVSQKKRSDVRCFVGLRMEDKSIPRHGHTVLRDADRVGVVTSGSLSPSLRVGIALASVDPRAAVEGTYVEVEIRGSVHPARVVPLPFHGGRKPSPHPRTP